MLRSEIRHLGVRDLRFQHIGAPTLPVLQKGVNLGDGDVDWGAVRQAFADVGYSGSVIAELEGGDETYLRDVSGRIDRLLGRS